MGFVLWSTKEKLRLGKHRAGVPRHTRRWLKRQMARWHRRQRKELLEDTPKKHCFKGWYW